MPRKKQFDPEMALQQAMELFWERGYEATSIQNLLDRLGINRFSLYDNFQGKKALYHAALDRYSAIQVAPLLQDMLDGPGGLSSVHGYFHRVLVHLSGPAGWWGCFMVNAAVEVAPRDRRTANRVEGHFQAQEQAFYRALVRSRKGGEISTMLPARALARFLSQASLSLNVMARTRAPLKALRQQVQMSLSVLGSQEGPEPRDAKGPNTTPT